MKSVYHNQIPDMKGYLPNIKDFIHQIYSQAKAEQREADAKVVEDFCLQGITFDDKVSIEASFKEKVALISIEKLTKAIRSQS